MHTADMPFGGVLSACAGLSTMPPNMIITMKADLAVVSGPFSSFGIKSVELMNLIIVTNTPNKHKSLLLHMRELMGDCVFV